MTYDTINDEEATPLTIQGGYSEDATGVKKHASSSIVRTMLVGTAVAVGVFLLMAGPSMNKSSNVEGMVSTGTEDDICRNGQICDPSAATVCGVGKSNWCQYMECILQTPSGEYRCQDCFVGRK